MCSWKLNILSCKLPIEHEWNDVFSFKVWAHFIESTFYSNIVFLARNK